MKISEFVDVKILVVFFIFLLPWVLAEWLEGRKTQTITYDHEIVKYKDPASIAKASNCKILVAGQDLTINCIGVKNESR